MITKLPENVAKRLPDIRNKWVTIGLSTERIDREKVEAAITKVFAAVSKPRPRHVITLRSPLEVMYAVALLRSKSGEIFRAQVRDQVSDQVRDQVSDRVSAQVSDQVRAQVRDQVSDLINNWWWWDFGQFDSYWCAFYEVMQEIGFKDDRLKPLEELVCSAGYTVLFWDWAFVSDRPKLVRRDERNRLHCETGPAIEYTDGFSVYAIHGVRVPKDVVKDRASITVERIDRELNAEIRRVMMERYGFGRYIVDSGTQEIQRDDFGVLYRKDMPAGDPIVCVKVVNSTPEPDGQFKDYWLRVAPDLRPLPPGEWPDDKKRAWFDQQQPQEMTAHNAVASTFGLCGEEYAPEIET